MITLLGSQKAIFATILCKLSTKVFVATNDGVYNLQRGGCILNGHVVKDAIDGTELRRNRGEVLPKHGAYGLNSLTALLTVGTNGCSQQFCVAVGCGLGTECSGSTIAVSTKTITSIEEVPEGTTKETANTSTPKVTSTEISKSAVTTITGK